MIKKIKENLSKLNKDNKGMSIVTVIVAIGFVLILVSIILSTSAINFKMRNMNVYSKDSFYSAEQVLDELNVGLQQMVQDGLSSAYVEVLSNYNDPELTSKDKDELVKGEFYNYIMEELGVDGKDSNHYVAMAVNGDTTKGLYKLLKSSTQWHEDTVEAAYGAFLRGQEETSTGNFYTLDDSVGKVYVGNMRMTNTDGIYLEDLNIFYRDMNGFVSTIKTDIHLVYPGFRFSNPDMPDISTYTLITDTALTSKGNFTDINIEGSSYCYKVDTTKTNLLFTKSENTPDINIVATDLNLKYGRIEQPKTSELWAYDINVESSKAHSSILTLAGTTYVRDDLNLAGNGNQLNIRGTYIGYGNSLDSDKDSSAILINGQNSRIDLEFSERVSLAGRAFVSLSSKLAKKNGVKKDIEGNELDKSVNEFYMGESIAAKSDQLMYLIPSECLGVAKTDAGKTLLAKEGIKPNNPMNRETYELITKNKNDIEEVALNKPVAKLGTAGNTLDEYLDISTPVKRLFLPTSDGKDTYVYYYMNFRNEEQANLFFAKYYGLNKDSVDKYMDKYIKMLSMPSEATAALKISMAGNATIKADEESDRKIAPYIKVLDGEASTLKEAFDKEYETYSKSFDGYCTRLNADLDSLLEDDYKVHGYKDLKDEEGNPTTDDKALFDNLVNKDNFLEIIDGSRLAFKDASGNTKVLLIHNADEKVLESVSSTDLDTCNLIVADCGLDLANLASVHDMTFEGCILAKGEIKVPAANCKFKAAPSKVDACMNMMTEDSVYSVYEIFTEADELAFISANNKKSEASMKVADLVQFSHWTKNVEIK